MDTKKKKKDDPRYMNVEAPGYEQRLRANKPGMPPRIVQVAAQVFRVSLCCLHWEFSGARLRCQCKGFPNPDNPSKGIDCPCHN